MYVHLGFLANAAVDMKQQGVQKGAKEDNNKQIKQTQYEVEASTIFSVRSQ
jgi:hypothetical protein